MASLLLRFWNNCEGKYVRKQNFNYCNESFWRGIERVAFVWSQLKFILAPSAMVIHHQPNNTVGGGGFDKKHGKRVEPENERAGVPVQQRNLSCLRQSVVILLVRITTTATLSAVSDIVVTLRCLLKLEKGKPQSERESNWIFNQPFATKKTQTQFRCSCVQKWRW